MNVDKAARIRAVMINKYEGREIKEERLIPAAKDIAAGIIPWVLAE